MKINNVYNVLSVSSIYYVLLRFCLLFLIDTHLKEILRYNPIESFSWFLIFYIIPIIISILLALRTIKFSFLKKTGRFFLPILLIITIIGSIFNYNYWGYFNRRPVIFSELKNANEILSITSASKEYEEETFVLNLESEYINLKNTYENDLYYDFFGRPIVAMLNKWGSRGNLYYWSTLYKSIELKLSEQELKELYVLIKSSGILEIPEEGYEKIGNSYSAVIYEFVTSDEDNATFVYENKTRDPRSGYDEKYLFAIIVSGEVSNDHRVVYEILISKNEIIKKQKYFYDVAGIEGIEYGIFSPFIEFIVLLFFLIVYFLVRTSVKLFNRNR